MLKKFKAGELSDIHQSAFDEAGASEADHGNGQVVFEAFKIGDMFNNANV